MIRMSSKLLLAIVGVLGTLNAAQAQTGSGWPANVVAESPSATVNPGFYSGEAEQFASQNVEQASWLWQQPPALSSPVSPSQPSTRSTRSRQGNIGLASVPNMFGDLGGASSAFITRIDDPNGTGGTTAGIFSLPIAGGGSRIGKISENDSPIPQDRVFFSYNHFHNAIEIAEVGLFPPGPVLSRQEPIDRYMMGFEKTFFDGWTSVELRMPLLGTIDSQLPSVGLSAGNIGNMTVVLKSLLYMDDSLAIGAGAAIETPTGSDTFVRIDGIRLQFRNDATHVLPYIGFVWSPGDPQWGWGTGLFLTGYAQIDINASSSRVDALGPNNFPLGTLGKLTDQNLGFLDLGAGYWLLRDPDAPRLTGLAVISELHYTTTLQDVDQLPGIVGSNAFVLNAIGNRFDVLNGTIGLQALLFDTSSLRVAGVFPLGDEDRRLFDAEVQVQFNRRF